jgi:hypothetical protein
MSEKSALRKAIEAAIASIGKIANKDATVQGMAGDKPGPKMPLHPKKPKDKSMSEYGYTREHKKAMEDAGVL